jgi:uncharacterized protein (TIGR03382 family)
MKLAPGTSLLSAAFVLTLGGPAHATSDSSWDDDPVCGNGTVEDPEECDDGTENMWVPGYCRPGCILPRCGDGIVDPWDECDDGNRDNHDGCDAECFVETPPPGCGDGTINPPEDCDDGPENGWQPGHCRPTCVVPWCGDGIVDPWDECDDGNKLNGDGCTDECFKETSATGSTSSAEGSTSAGDESSSTSGGLIGDTGCGCTQPTNGSPTLVLAALILLIPRHRRRSPARLRRLTAP